MVVVPPLATAPSDFSRMVVRPPALLPGEGLLFISPPVRAQWSSHQRMRSTIFSPTARLAARQKMLGAVDLRRLRQHRAAAVAHQQVDRRAERRIGRDAGIAVRTAALQ